MDITLTPAEQELAETIGFNPDILLIAREAGSPLARLVALDDEGDEVECDGIVFPASEDASHELVAGLRGNPALQGHLVFLSEMNFGYDTDKIAIIKGSDQFDILRIKQTNGANYEIENQQIIDRLQDWNARFGINIIGADFDWVEAEFVKQPDDMAAFADEVYAFCPDSVEQGAGSVEELAEAMEEFNMIYLWWD